MRYKTPKLKEKVAMYERFLHAINMCVTCANNDGVRELVSNADKFSYAHRRGNGELSDREQQQLINAAFWKLCDTPKTDQATAERKKVYAEKQTS